MTTRVWPVAFSDSAALRQGSGNDPGPGHILDNDATHRHAEVETWLDGHPRVRIHFVPTSSSWLNLAERFFSELKQRQLKRLALHSVGQLVHAIRPTSRTATVPRNPSC